MEDFKNLDTYQKWAKTTAIYPDNNTLITEGNPYYAALGLAGEVGELCNKLKKVMRDEDGVLTIKFLKDIEKELGDVLWYLAACASEFGLELGTIAEKNLGKLMDRKARGKLKGSGDDR